MMHVACAANRAYLPHVAAMLHSLLAQHPGEVRVHFLHDDRLPAEDIAVLADFVRSISGHWTAHEVDAPARARFPDNYHFGKEAWYRILLPELLPGESRVLYLDADTIVRRPIEHLWRTQLEGKVLGAVVNPLYGFMDTGFMGRLGVASPDDYFNSGVLLIDLDRWRAEGITEQLMDFIRERGARQAWPDQNALNSVLRERWYRLPPEWNVQNVYYDLRLARIPYPEKLVREARADPAIVHYSAPYKPWDYLCKHPFQQTYLEHVAATPWRGLPLRGKTWTNRLLRLLPQPFMWISGVHLRRLWGRIRRRI